MKNIKFKIVAIVVGIIIIAIISIFIIRNNSCKQGCLLQNVNGESFVESVANNENNIISDNTINNNAQKEYLDGHEIAGYIEIPKTNLNAPILAEANAQSLDLSAVIMYGVGLNNVGNTVITGGRYPQDSYNYELSFSNNYKLSVGDIIYITDQTKEKVTYEVYDINTFKAKDDSYYERDTQGRREITLVTESSDEQYNRLVVFAREK